MKIHSLIQGSPDWHSHRANFFNASEAPAMMSCSPYETRTQLLHRMKTGITKDVDDSTQRRFDEGHRIEALARAWAEEHIFDGEFLYPVVGSEGEYSASFDGLIDDYSKGFEHKTLNDELRACMSGGFTRSGFDLPMMYRVQMEQQCMVSGAECILFMASKWNGDQLVEECHCWYDSDPDLRAAIIAGWEQFEKDLAAYVPTEVKEMPKAQITIDLPALFVHAKGEITTHNMQEFGSALKAKLAEVRAIVLLDDQDFANAKASAKMFRDKAKEIALSKEAMLSQTVTIGEAARMMDAWAKDLNGTALQLEKDVEREDAAKKATMVSEARAAFTHHVMTLQAEIIPITLLVQQPAFAEALKGKRNYASMQDAISTALAGAKIEADAEAKELRAKLSWFKAEAISFNFLFHDLSTIIRKPVDDFQLLVTSRIDVYKKAQAEKEEAQRAAIRAEEAAKLEREAELAQKARDAIAAAPAMVVPTPATAQIVGRIVPLAELVPTQLGEQMPQSVPTLKLGQIAERLGFALPADFLANLGFVATTERNAKLYNERDFPLICMRMIAHIQSVQMRYAT